MSSNNDSTIYDPDKNKARSTGPHGSPSPPLERSEESTTQDDTVHTTGTPNTDAGSNHSVETERGSATTRRRTSAATARANSPDSSVIVPIVPNDDSSEISVFSRLSGLSGVSGLSETSRTRIPVERILEEGNFRNQVRLAYEGSLIKLHGSSEVTVHLGELNQIHLELLRQRLISHAFEIRYQKMEDYNLDRARRDMTAYIEAVRNLAYMTEFRERDAKHDPFRVSTEWTLQRTVMKDMASAALDDKIMGWKLNLSEDSIVNFLKDLTPYGPHELEHQDVKRFWDTRTKAAKAQERENYAKRAAMAVIGGAFLVGPMLIMVLHPGLVTSLVTTSACVIVFGLVVALPGLLDKPSDVLSATAAYAAVLVVFVGTSGTSA